jgi:hypothetical protein
MKNDGERGARGVRGNISAFADSRGWAKGRAGGAALHHLHSFSPLDVCSFFSPCYLEEKEFLLFSVGSLCLCLSPCYLEEKEYYFLFG